jgi:hypothetical protein
MKGTFNFDFDQKSLNNFEARCEAAIRNLGGGAKKATIAACEEILGNSMAEVPKDTYTLLMSAFYEVSRRTDTAASTWAYEAIIGYGGNGDPVNPKTGRRASSYMVKVHEDLSVYHHNGKAKFLEDPVREYARENFPRTVFKYAQESLATMSD